MRRPSSSLNCSQCSPAIKAWAISDRKGIAMFLGVLGQPEKKLATGLMLADEAAQQFLELLPMLPCNQGMGDFRSERNRHVPWRPWPAREEAGYRPDAG